MSNFPDFLKNNNKLKKSFTIKETVFKNNVVIDQRKDYKRYIESDVWKRRRKKVYSKYGYKCCRCKCKNKTLEAHHKTYKYKFGSKQEFKILICLCSDCHAAFHKKYKYNSIKHKFYKANKKKVKKRLHG